MKDMKVKDLMIECPSFISPDMSIREAAIRMKEENWGVLPVGKPENPLGIITDRDLIICALLNGLHNEKPVENFMSRKIVFCNEDDNPKEAATVMRENRVNHMIVKNKEGKISGMVTFSDTY